jgi:DNA ligase-1
MRSVIKKGPVLLDESAKTGKMKYWQLLLLTDGTDFYIQKTSWLGEDGKKLEATPTRIEGKNVGRSNATTDKEQALLAFERAIQRRRDKGYSESGTSTHVPTKPMLAQGFEKRKHAITWPVYVQPKYDGHRMLMNGKRAWTRGGKDHILAVVQHLMFDTEGYTLDGEIMLPKGRFLAESSSAIKNSKNADSKKLVYYVYDVVSVLPYSNRYELLQELLADAPENVELVPTVVAETPEEVWAFHDKAVKAGFEGAIVRLDGRGYENDRSDQLLKVKAFQDAEFQVVSVDEGEGSNVGLAILVLDCGKNKTFRAVPEGGMELRRKLWKARHSLLGQVWTVRYFYKSKDGVPIYPVAVAQREEGQ